MRLWQAANLLIFFILPFWWSLIGLVHIYFVCLIFGIFFYGLMARILCIFLKPIAEGPNRGQYYPLNSDAFQAYALGVCNSLGFILTYLILDLMFHAPRLYFLTVFTIYVINQFFLIFGSGATGSFGKARIQQAVAFAISTASLYLLYINLAVKT